MTDHTITRGYCRTGKTFLFARKFQKAALPLRRADPVSTAIERRLSRRVAPHRHPTPRPLPDLEKYICGKIAACDEIADELKPALLAPLERK